MLQSFLYHVDCIKVFLAVMLITFIVFTFFKKYRRVATIGVGFLMGIGIIFLASICVEWPMGIPFWNRENGKWVRHTSPMFHWPFSFTGLRECPGKNNISVQFHLAGRDPTILVTMKAEAEFVCDVENMETYCESVGPHWYTFFDDTRTTSYAEEGVVRDELKSMIRECSKEDLLNVHARWKILDDRLRLRGFRLKRLLIEPA